MRTQKTFLKSTTLTAIFLAVFVMGSYAQTSNDQEKDEKREKITQAISTTIPSDGDQDVERDTPIEITLSEDMELDQETIDNATFVLKESASERDGEQGMQRNQEDMQHDEDMQQEQEDDMDYEDETDYETETDQKTQDPQASSEDMKTIEGTVEIDGNTVRFIPNQTLRAHTQYVLTMNTEDTGIETPGQQEQDWQQDEQDENWEQDEDWEQEEQDQEQEWEQDQTEQGREMAQTQGQEWKVTFTTGGREEPLEMVNLGSAGNYVVLANAIHNETTSDISGEFGAVEEDEDGGMGMNEEETTEETQTDTTTQQGNTGMGAGQTASGDPNQALEDLRSAYEEVQQLTNPDFEDVFEGEISGKTLTPGLYKWSNTVEIDSVVTLSGSAEDIWVFQVSEDLNLNEDVEIQLEDGAVPENVIWQVAGEVALRSGSHAEGVLLTMNEINLENGASVNGRMLAVNDISLDQNVITAPDMFRADRRTGETGPEDK